MADFLNPDNLPPQPPGEQGTPAARRASDQPEPGDTTRLNPFDLERQSWFRIPEAANEILELQTKVKLRDTEGKLKLDPPDIIHDDPFYWDFYYERLVSGFNEHKQALEIINSDGQPLGETDMLKAAYFAGDAAIRATESELSLNTDPLTGLPNERYLKMRLPVLLERAMQGGYQLGFTMLDYDDFKLFNTEGGYEAGDASLINFRNIVKSSFREGDYVIIGRIHGDEFYLITLGLPESTLRVRGQHIMANTRQHLITTLPLESQIKFGKDATVSGAGAMFSPEFGVPGEERLENEDALQQIDRVVKTPKGAAKAANALVAHASVALTHAKASEGKGKFFMYLPGMQRITNLPKRAE